MQKSNESIYQIIAQKYREIVFSRYPDELSIWPVASGYNVRQEVYSDHLILIYEHTGLWNYTQSKTIGFHKNLAGVDFINETNIDGVRDTIRSKLRLDIDSAIVILRIFGNPDGTFIFTEADALSELNKMLRYHEIITGVVKMKLFLSHKSTDKTMVREYKRTLAEMGFDVWLDEDAMSAGTELHRGILQGFKDSCAAIFFITPDFIDEGFLQNEINQAMSEKISKKEPFSIITLVFTKDGKKGQVPELLKNYVWKEPQNDLQAIQEILKALPIKLSPPNYK